MLILVNTNNIQETNSSEQIIKCENGNMFLMVSFQILAWMNEMNEVYGTASID